MDKDSRGTLNNGIGGKLNDVQRGLKPQEASRGSLPQQENTNQVRTNLFLGFDAECLSRIASSITLESIINSIRGEVSSDGISRNSINGLYRQYGIPDIIIRSKSMNIFGPLRIKQVFGDIGMKKVN